jgi:hypothetical protein
MPALRRRFKANVAKGVLVLAIKRIEIEDIEARLSGVGTHHEGSEEPAVNTAICGDIRALKGKDNGQPRAP